MHGGIVVFVCTYTCTIHWTKNSIAANSKRQKPPQYNTYVYTCHLGFGLYLLRTTVCRYTCTYKHVYTLFIVSIIIQFGFLWPICTGLAVGQTQQRRRRMGQSNPMVQRTLQCIQPLLPRHCHG